MRIGSELVVLKDDSTYYADSIRFALSISPYSIPADQTLGLEVTRTTELPDIVRYQVIQMLRVIAPNADLSCNACYVVGDQIILNITDNTTDETVQYTLS